jgi:hypothetical protein
MTINGGYIPKPGYIRQPGTAADKQYVDQDIFCSQHSRKPLVERSYHFHLLCAGS